MDKTIISKETLMPISFVISLFAGMMWLSGKLNDINIKLDQMETKLQDQWSSTEMENWSLKLKLKNPALEIPEVN